MNSIVEIKNFPENYIIDLSNIKFVKFSGAEDYGSIEIELLRGNENIFKHPDETEIITHTPKIEIDFVNEKVMNDFKEKLMTLWEEYNNWKTDKEVETIMKNLG